MKNTSLYDVNPEFFEDEKLRHLPDTKIKGFTQISVDASKKKL